MSDWADGRAFLITAACLFAIALPFQFLIDRARLEISPEGVCLRQTGYRLETFWANVAELRLDRTREGFVTVAPIQSKGAARLAAFRGVGIAGAPMFTSQQQALLAEQRFIPIEAFAWHLRHGTLGDEIKRFAPHLQLHAAAEANDKLSRQQLWKLAMVCVPVIMLSAGLAILPSYVQSAHPWGEMTVLAVLCSMSILFSFRTAVSAWRYFGKRTWLPAFFFGISALILLLLAIVWFVKLITGWR